MSTDTLERHYRLLLRAYPAAYRRERGEEILAAVLEVEGGRRRRPSVGQARAIVLGGLRVRQTLAHGDSTAALAWHSAALAAIALVMWGATASVEDFVWRADNLVLEGKDVWSFDYYWYLLKELYALPSLVLLLLALLTAHRRTAAVIAVSTLFAITGFEEMPVHRLGWWTVALAVPLVVADLRRPADVPGLGLVHLRRFGGVLLAGVAAAVLLDAQGVWDVRPALVLLTVAVTALLVAPLDPRPALATAAASVPGVAQLLVHGSISSDREQFFQAVAALLVVTLALGTFAAHMRQRARI